jgi:hypothetical protein
LTKRRACLLASWAFFYELSVKLPDTTKKDDKGSDKKPDKGQDKKSAEPIRTVDLDMFH